MSELPVDLASVYRTMDALSLQNELYMAVPTELRIFGADICAEVADLSDEAVVNLALQLDAEEREVGSRQVSLIAEFNKLCYQPPAEYAADPALITAWAMHRLRVGTVSRRFETEYPAQFPERAGTGYKKGMEFTLGSALASMTMGQFLSNPL